MSFLIKIGYNDCNLKRGYRKGGSDRMYIKEIKVPISGTEETLYVTDQKDTAEALRRAGEAVLIYLHSGNRNQDFSSYLFAGTGICGAGLSEAEGAALEYSGDRQMPCSRDNAGGCGSVLPDLQ